MTRLISSTARADAILTDRPTYTTGIACRNGHHGPRDTASAECRQCRRDRWRRWRDRHPAAALDNLERLLVARGIMAAE